MNQRDSQHPRDIEKLLRSTPTAEPPADLLERLRRDLPPNLSLPVGRPAPAVGGNPFARPWYLAAAVFVGVLLSAGVAFQVFFEPGAPMASKQARAALEGGPAGSVEAEGFLVHELEDSTADARATEPVAAAPGPAPAGRAEVDPQAGGTLPERGYLIAAGASPPTATLIKLAPTSPRLEGSVEAGLTQEVASSVLSLRSAPPSLERVRVALARGELPTSEEVEVAAFVNEVQPPAASAAQDGFRLEVEGAPSFSRRWVLRRLLRVTLAGRLASATDVEVTVALNPRVVRRWSLLSGASDEATMRPAQALPRLDLGSERSVTALYELELIGLAPGRSQVAEVRLHYRDEPGGRRRQLRQAVLLEEFASRWEEASQGLRLASLAAGLAGILKHPDGKATESPAEVYRLAQEMARQLEGRREVVELAEMAGQVRDLMAN